MKNADQARDDSMEEILASIRKIIADDEAAGGSPLDPLAPVGSSMGLETESLEAAFGREPFFEPARAAAASAGKAGESVPMEDIMELSEDFLVAEGDLDNPFGAPSPFQADPRPPARSDARVEPQLSSSGHGRQFTPSPFPELATEPQRVSAEDDGLYGERRLWDGQPAIPLRATKSEPVQPQLSTFAPHRDAPRPAPQTNTASSTTDPRVRPPEPASTRPPARQGWAGPRDLGRDATSAAEAARPRPGPSLDSAPVEPFWAQPDINPHAVGASSRPSTPRKEPAAPKEPSLRASQPAQPQNDHAFPSRSESPASARMDNSPSHSRLAAPVTPTGSTTVLMPQLPDSPEHGPISAASEENDADGRPQYFQTMAEELVRATVTGMADRELNSLNAKKSGDTRPDLRAVAESFAETMSHGAGRSEEKPPSHRMQPAEARSHSPAPLTVKATGPQTAGQQAPELVKQSQGGAGQRSLEDGFKELLKPMLMEWLNENMPRMLENAVQQELERRSGKKD